MIFKKIVGRMLFCSWVVLFALYYFFDARGVLYGWRVMAENDELKQQLQALRSESERVRSEIEQWQREPFFHEAMAREQLQLAHADDQIYYFS